MIRGAALVVFALAFFATGLSAQDSARGRSGDSGDGGAALEKGLKRGKYRAFESFQKELRSIIERVRRSTVTISIGNNREARPGRNGAGVVIDNEGHVLTNNALVNGARKIHVTFRDGRRVRARVLGSDPHSDVALLRVPPEGLEPIKMGDSGAVRVGQLSIALGDPFGLASDAQPSVNLGIISSTFRVRGSPFYKGTGIQTTANLNPGSEGGPLVDIRGRLIGICGRIERTTQTGHAVSYAIPINQIRAVLPELKSGAPIPDGALGLTIDSEGYITSFKSGSAAEAAGLRVDDVVTHIDGHVVKSRRDVDRLVRDLPIGTKIVLRIERDGRLYEKTLSIERGPSKF